MELEPFTVDPELRADYRIASIVQVIANVNRGKGQRPYTLQDFLLKFNEPPQRHRQTPEEQEAILRAIAIAYSAPAKDM